MFPYPALINKKVYCKGPKKHILRERVRNLIKTLTNWLYLLSIVARRFESTNERTAYYSEYKSFMLLGQ